MLALRLFNTVISMSSTHLPMEKREEGRSAKAAEAEYIQSAWGVHGCMQV
jgi:hypothetical protein